MKGDGFMRILRHGCKYLEDNNLDSIECRECGCEFEFSKDEVKSEIFRIDDYFLFPNDKLWIDGCGYEVKNIEMMRYIKCPECGDKHLLRPKTRNKER